ncbi:uncharacterized protein BDW47DRAFT_113524 [Aspergillus candidus]|uniref:GDS1 winged helix domain-containing protein n=1 Tax=Aspergillus candidus TaxID=41067 RepID=A0A2I2EZ63_ASPCN|nr:hypothetical protein BDW47DRAFT_113524 [Aspergillus candidus]PLB33671.1 hypothetical protein BDW47DRAFT_113524 [Aspergillus candidus]
MPYNTRRKSLSLPSLGIHLPSSSRRSPSTTKSSHATDDQLPPPKKVKRSHHSGSLSPEPSTQIKGQFARPSGRRATVEHTPPPSPADLVAPKIDTEGISDDIVVGVIEQLEKTGNRPHLVKELAAILLSFNDNVANSANPAALLSSRLNTYMKRPWTALAPCPLAKELIPVHPRKVYYYLNSMPRQPFPENSDDIVIPGMEGNSITPSVSSVDMDEDDAFARERSRLSPSPEVDLSPPEDDENAELGGRDGSNSAGHRADFTDPHHARLSSSHRAASPPLEGDEKEFTQTASAVRERASSEQKASQFEGVRGGFSALTEGLNELDARMNLADSPVDDGPLSSISSARFSGSPDSDYFSPSASERSPLDSPFTQISARETAGIDLLGTSPSPSLTSVASSLSSGTSVVSDDGLDLDLRTEALAGAPQISLPEDPDATPVSTLKRSIDMLNSGLPDLDLEMSDLTEPDTKLSLRTQDFANTDIEMVFASDSWRELQSPETVDVHELDEMFDEI